MLRFPLVSAFSEVSGLRPLQDALKESFPTLEPGSATQIEVTIAAHGIQQQQTALPKWVFSGHDAKYELIVTPALVQLSVPGSEYADRAAFASVLKLVVSAIQSSYDVQRIDAFAVRYVNAIAAVQSWHERINPAVLGWIAENGVNAVGRFSMTQTGLSGGAVTLPSKLAVTTNAVVRHGLVAGVGPDLIPDALNKPTFIVDCELSTAQATALNLELVLELFREYNHEMAHFFNFALTDAGREYYGLEYL